MQNTQGLHPLTLIVVLAPAVVGAYLANGGEARSLDGGMAAVRGALAGLGVGVVLALGIWAASRRRGEPPSPSAQ